jgi:hypothetical protein
MPSIFLEAQWSSAVIGSRRDERRKRAASGKRAKVGSRMDSGRTRNGRVGPSMEVMIWPVRKPAIDQYSNIRP